MTLTLTSVWAGTQPANPLPLPDITNYPTTPEGRRTYKIDALKTYISQDEATIANPGGGKSLEVQERVKAAKKNLAMNKKALEKIQNGADMEVYFCSKCGREYMKEGTCPHCQITMKSLFTLGAKRPPVPLD